MVRSQTFTIGIDAGQGGRGGLTHVTLNRLTITHPQGALVQTTAIYLLNATFSTVSHCNLSNYAIGTYVDSTSSSHNSYTDNTFRSVSFPFTVSGPDAIGIPMVTEQLPQ
jgi:hypothetical protein